MEEVKVCPECGVPEPIYQQLTWLNSGVIVQKGKETTRLSFIESENLDPLFDGISEIIGVPVERLVIETARRGTASYVRGLIPPEVRELARTSRTELDFLISAMFTTMQLFGYAKCELSDFSYEGGEDDYGLERVADPCSVPIFCGCVAGACEGLVGREFGVDYKEVSPGIYEITACVSKHPAGLKGRLKPKEYHHRDGDIELERCGTCGGPAGLSGFKWNLDRGRIENTFTGRRLAVISHTTLDPIFGELKEELGETIPAVVVEAQRRFVKTGFSSIEEVSDEGDFRNQLALRGLGNLRELEMGAKGLRMRIDNAGNHLMIVGLVQGLFEMAFGVNSHVEWEFSGEGDLEMEVTPTA